MVFFRPSLIHLLVFFLLISGSTNSFSSACVVHHPALTQYLIDVKTGKIQQRFIAESEIEQAAEQLAFDFIKVTEETPHQASFKMVIDPREALATRIMMIREAKDSIDLSYYIFKDSETSRILLAELKNALKRGVNVRLMVDGSGSIISGLSSFKEIQTLMKVKGGPRYDGQGNLLGNATFEAVVINPMVNVRAHVKTWYNNVSKVITGKQVANDHFSIFQRSHEKILLVDTAIPEQSRALIGGRNISNDYYSIGASAKDPYNDLDILIKGVSAPKNKDGVLTVENAVQEHFNRLYVYTANTRFNDFIFKVGRNSAAKQLKKIRNDRNRLANYKGGELVPLLDKMEKEKFLDSDLDQGYISILDEFENLTRTNPIKQKDNLYTSPKSIMSNLWNQISHAKKDILITTPYLYLTDKEIKHLVGWLKEDPTRKLRIMTNSSATSDNLFAQSMMENFVMPKLVAAMKESEIPAAQFDIMAYGTKEMKKLGGEEAQGKLHAKFWMVDNNSIGVGTSNFDPVSRRTNSEIMANVFPIKGKSSVSSLNNYYDELKSKSTHWSSKEFEDVKHSPELKKNLMIQEFIAKILRKTDLLPQ